MTYQQRRAERRVADAERRQKETRQDPFYSLPADERRRLRQAEEQGRRDAERLAAVEERAKRQAEIDATPEHLRRPENVFTRLIAEWQDKAYRPEIARRLKEYKKLEAKREKELDGEMAEKLRQYEVENNPETKVAREHWTNAVSGAESEEERREFARLRGVIEAGNAGDYWSQVAPIMQARLDAIQGQLGDQIERQHAVVSDTERLADELDAVQELQVTDPEDE